MSVPQHLERLCPEAQTLLSELAKNPRPSSRDLPLDEGRRNFRELLALSSATAPAVDTCDVKLATGTGALRARLYRSASTPNQPVVLYFHGGGWVFGDVDSHDWLCRALASASAAAVLSVDYRRPPEHPFPAASDDAYSSVRWISEHGAELGVDPTRVAVAGDSAGGNLAASASLRVRDEGGFPIRAQVLICPALDPALATASAAEFADDPFLSVEEMRWYWDRYAPNPADRRSAYAAPGTADNLGGLPDTLVITAELDILRDEAETFADRARVAGTRVVVHREPGMMHAFPALAGQLSGGRDVIDRIGATLRGVLADDLQLVRAWHQAETQKGKLGNET